MTFAEFIKTDEFSNFRWYLVGEYLKELEDLMDPLNAHKIHIAGVTLLEAGRHLHEALNTYFSSETLRLISEIDTSEPADVETRNSLSLRRAALEECQRTLVKKRRVSIPRTLDSDEVWLRMRAEGLEPHPAPSPEEQEGMQAELNGSEMGALLSELSTIS